MNVTLSSAKASYLTRVAEGLADLSEEDREEVLHELEAHLAEVDDPEVVPTLGTPEEFVAEFRQSAGLSSKRVTPNFAATRQVLVRVRTTLEHFTAAIDWPRFRPAWVWVRGWLLVSSWAILANSEGFSRFPIPQIGRSTLTGLTFVVVATVVSVWLEKGSVEARRQSASAVYSFVAALALVASFLNPVHSSRYVVTEDPASYSDRLTTAGLEPVQNIYAYDLEGNPVEVLLFDQQGRPLLSMPDWVYGEAELNPGRPISYGEGEVVFLMDQFGRVIPNLYPLQIYSYDQLGRLRLVPPPSLGVPSIDSGEAGSSVEPGPTTTIWR